MSDAPENRSKASKFVERPGGVVNIYANTINLGWSQYDLRIRFGEVLHTQGYGDAAVLVVEERAAVTISWAEAKFLQDQIGDLIRRYESVNGEIMPPKLAPPPSRTE